MRCTRLNLALAQDVPREDDQQDPRRHQSLAMCNGRPSPSTRKHQRRTVERERESTHHQKVLNLTPMRKGTSEASCVPGERPLTCESETVLLQCMSVRVYFRNFLMAYFDNRIQLLLTTILTSSCLY